MLAKIVLVLGTLLVAEEEMKMAEAAEEVDPLVRAIRSKSDEQLREICTKMAEAGTGLYCPPGAEHEALSAMIYKHAQEEVPPEHRKPTKPWPGPGEAAAAKRAAPGGGGGGGGGGGMPTDAKSIASMMFSRMDRDADGSLSKAEMQPMIDSTNAQAKARGEPTVDNLFEQIDKDGDGVLARAEAEAYFGLMAGKIAAAESAAKSKPAQKGGGAADVAGALFKNLDKNSDGVLTREEMASVITKTDAHSKARGEAPEDFFGTLDADADGLIDMQEADHFFKEMARAGLMGEKQKEEL